MFSVHLKLLGISSFKTSNFIKSLPVYQILFVPDLESFWENFLIFILAFLTYFLLHIHLYLSAMQNVYPTFDDYEHDEDDDPGYEIVNLSGHCYSN